jgi:hypothetical protein
MTLALPFPLAPNTCSNRISQRLRDIQRKSEQFKRVFAQRDYTVVREETTVTTKQLRVS